MTTTAETVAETVPEIVEIANELASVDMTPDLFHELMERFGDWLLSAGSHLLIAVLIMVIGMKLIGKVRQILSRSMEKTGVEITLRKFLDALVYALLMGILVFMAAEQLGIKATSLIAVAGSVGLALSLAMEKTLANFAGGVMVLLLKPFKVGDFISTSDGEGTVDSIGLVYTTLVTADNQRINIPNSNMTSNVVTNVTGTDKRKLILDIGISYNADLKKAKEVLQHLLENHPGIMNEEGIQVVDVRLGESSVNLSARGWTKTGDYWTTRWELLEAIKLSFDKEGIEIPYNYLNVNLIKNP